MYAYRWPIRFYQVNEYVWNQIWINDMESRLHYNTILEWQYKNSWQRMIPTWPGNGDIVNNVTL